jgi:hypothetical protein
VPGSIAQSQRLAAAAAAAAMEGGGGERAYSLRQILRSSLRVPLVRC